MTFRLVVILNIKFRTGHRFLGYFSPAMELAGRWMPSRNGNAQIPYLCADKPSDAKHGQLKVSVGLKEFRLYSRGAEASAFHRKPSKRTLRSGGHILQFPDLLDSLKTTLYEMGKFACPLFLARKTRFWKRACECDYIWRRHADGEHRILIDDPIEIDLAVRRSLDIRFGGVYRQFLDDLMRNPDKTGRNRKSALAVPVF